MPVTYEAWLVAALDRDGDPGRLCRLEPRVQIAGAPGSGDVCLLAGATVSFAVAIWTMHFVGMLAVRLPFPGRLSGLPDTAVVSGLRDRGRRGGVCHQFGTADAAAPDTVRLPHGRRHLHHALHRHERARCQHAYGPRPGLRRLPAWRSPSPRPDWRSGSATGRAGRPPLILSASAFGMAISGMHYTAMGGVTLYPFVTAASARRRFRRICSPSSSRSWRSVFPAYSSCCSCPIRPASSSQDAAVARAARRKHGDPAVAAVPATGRRDSRQSRTRTRQLRTARRRRAPPRRFARHLPVERDGSTQFLAVEDVVAVHANAHYTYIFDGNDKLFCPLAIGDVESRLDERSLRARPSQPHRQYRPGRRLQAVRRQRAGRDGRARRLPRAGQPQPHRLAEIAASRRLTATTRSCTSPPAPFCSAIDSRRASSALASIGHALTQFVQNASQFVQPAGHWCISGKLVQLLLLLRRTSRQILQLQKVLRARSRDRGDDLGRRGPRQGGCRDTWLFRLSSSDIRQGSGRPARRSRRGRPRRSPAGTA